MGPILMLGTIRGVAECFTAFRIFAGVRFLAGMRSQMRFQIFQSRVLLAAPFELSCTKGGEKENRFVIIFGELETTQNLILPVCAHPHSRVAYTPTGEGGQSSYIYIYINIYSLGRIST